MKSKSRSSKDWTSTKNTPLMSSCSKETSAILSKLTTLSRDKVSTWMLTANITHSHRLKMKSTKDKYSIYWEKELKKKRISQCSRPQTLSTRTRTTASTETIWWNCKALTSTTISMTILPRMHNQSWSRISTLMQTKNKMTNSEWRSTWICSNKWTMRKLLIIVITSHSWEHQMRIM